MSNYIRLRPFTDIEICECSNVTGLLLVYIYSNNPIHCLKCKNSIDPERLLLSTKQIDKIADCFSVKGSLTRLWLDSGEYEVWAKEKLLDPKGQVNIQGMAIAKELSGQWPTYYWWFHDEEDDEPEFCPNCEDKLYDEEVIWGTRKCNLCRIVV